VAQDRDRGEMEKLRRREEDFSRDGLYGDCVIFDIGGNNYRLIAKIDHKYELVSIKAVMTHAEYDKDKWKKNC
jgi:mRNA interferase HigB